MRPQSPFSARREPRSAGRPLPTAYCLLPTRRRRGFTLVELLVVIFIILLISAVALPAILPALAHREISEAARLLQGSLVGARDAAIHSNQPSGIRLLPDPTLNGIGSSGLLDSRQILASSRMVPLSPAPEYSEGMVSVTPSPSQLGVVYQIQVPYPQGGYYPAWGGAPGKPNVLMIEECPYDMTTGLLNAPTSWFWNIRVGDKIQINGAGPWYTVVGPMMVAPHPQTAFINNGGAAGNAEMFVNVGVPGTTSPLVRPGPGGSTYNAEFLFLVNGQDDDANGWVDEGWDGVNNNVGTTAYDPTGLLVDDLSEWETETWLGTLATHPATNQPYTIRRRPAPSVNSREVALPSSVVIDLTGWGQFTNTAGATIPAPYERSIVPGSMFNLLTGYVDIMINPDGSVLPTTIYSSPSSFSLGSAFTHLWLADRGDLAQPSLTRSAAPFLPLPQGLAPALFNGQEIKGNYALLTIFNRTGEIVVNENMTFDNPTAAAAVPRPYNTFLPFLPAQQGLNGGGQ